MSDWELFTESEETQRHYQAYLIHESTGDLADDITFTEWLDTDDAKIIFEEWKNDMADEAYERNFERGRD